MGERERTITLDEIPIIGQRIDQRAIDTVESVLARLKKGELLNVAVAAEQSDGNMFMSLSGGHGDRMKLRGALGTMAAMIDKAILGGK